MRAPLKIYCEKEVDEKLRPLINNHDLLSLVSMEECDIILHPNVLWADKQTEKKLAQISSAHKTSNKKVVILIVHDFEFKYKYHKNLLLFRTSMRSTLKRNNEYVLPYSWECSENAFASIKSSKKPIVGFCGMISHHRKKIIEKFKSNEDVEHNFVLREKFWGGAPHDPIIVNEFNENMKASQFILCNRGGGNFSMRFYQALAFGRIPVLVNTNIALPLNQLIPWKDFIVFGKDENECLEKVIQCHQQGRSEDMQRICRTIFDKYLHPNRVLFFLIRDALQHASKKTSSFERFKNLIGLSN